MRARWVPVALLGCLLVSRASGAQPPDAPARFAVAVSEGYDGKVLLPIARYEAGRWLNTWPEPESDDTPVPALPDVPTAWLGRPVPAEWTLWFTGGGSTRLQIVGTERSGGCVVSPKLTVGDALAPREGSYDEVHPGLATTDGAPVEPVELVLAHRRRRTSAGADALRPKVELALAALCAAREQKTLSTALHDGQGPVTFTPRQLSALAPRIDWLYRAGDVVYLEASKYAPAPATERLTISGWLRVPAAGELVPLAVDAELERYYEAPVSGVSDVSGRVPLGVLRAGGREVWVMEAHYVEAADWLLYEIGPASAREILRTAGGGC
jgi:hypothetical protein